MKKDFLSVEDVSIELKLSKRKIRKLFHDKKLPGRKIAGKYIITRDSLKNFIDEKENTYV